ncbi:hypothetical protein P4J00_23805 [Bacillus cereus]|nr:hypothetical protein [Bacillus cereus]
MIKIDHLVNQTLEIFNTDGVYSDFQFTQINADGSFTGNLQNEVINGTFDSNSGKITFGHKAIIAVVGARKYTGFIFTDKHNPSLFTMAGTVSSGTALTRLFSGGFFAQIERNK